MKLVKNTEYGFSHILVPLVVVVGVAIVGSYFLVKSHADPITSSNSSTSTNWQLLSSASNKETTVSVYSCLNEASKTQWWIKAEGTLSPIVSDASSYTVAIDLGNGVKGGGSSSNTWTKNDITNFEAGFNPTTQSPSQWSVTPSIQFPSSDPGIKGGGGAPVLISNLNRCY